MVANCNYEEGELLIIPKTYVPFFVSKHLWVHAMYKVHCKHQPVCLEQRPGMRIYLKVHVQLFISLFVPAKAVGIWYTDLLKVEVSTEVFEVTEF